MVKNFFDKIATRTRMGFFAAFFLLLISYILTFISTRKVATQDYWINHTNEVIHDLDNTMGFLTKCESAFRGFLLTNDKKLLQDYDDNIKKTDSTFFKLQKITSDNKIQQKNLDTLRALIDKKFFHIENIISTHYKNKDEEIALLLKQNNDSITQSSYIEKHITKMKEEETSLWNSRSHNASRYSGLIRILNIISVIIAILLSFYSLIVYNKENKERRKASIKAEQYKIQLQSRVEQLADLNRELIELRSLEKYSVTGRIARVIAHEVRNPLTNINLASEQLKSEMEENKSTNILFTMISRNSERINNLVSDLLNTTRVSELKVSKISINKLLDEALGLAADRIELKEIEVVKDYDVKICPISVDTEKVKIAFLNIIVNAIEAMDKGGILKISTSVHDNKCIIKISDNGIGMKKSEVDRLFEPYFTTKEKGNGLGLANSQNIILAHEGSISAESEPGKGTVFTITFHIN